MNTMTINSSTTPSPASGWPTTTRQLSSAFSSGSPAGSCWSGFPFSVRRTSRDVPPQILQFADQHQEAMRWPIHRPEDLLGLPEGITGWLLPADAIDTDVACGVWNGEVYILGVQDKHTGRSQALLGERADAATADAGQSAV
ncbi:MAG: hypothetical protein IPO38_10575 [Rhodocyclaceae bacterium]|nr:hypothetical protein [Rhodocyclaceae bacterium]